MMLCEIEDVMSRLQNPVPAKIKKKPKKVTNKGSS